MFEVFMELTVGVPLRLVNEEVSNLISLNTGTYQEADNHSRIGNFLPKMDWRVVTSSELALLTKGDPQSCVAIGNAGRKCYEGFRRLAEVLQVGARTNLSQGEIARDFPDCLGNLFLEIDPLIKDGDSLGLEGAQIDKAGEITLAFNRASQQFIGLHIDGTYFERLKLDGLRSISRFSLNIGMESRYFLFVNLPLKQLELRVGLEVGKHSAGVVTEAFFKRFPSYPVVRLELPPGWFYYAPVYELIHDGSSLGMSSPDITIAARGIFH